MQQNELSEQVAAGFETLIGRLNDRLAEMVEALAWYATDANYAGATPDILFDAGATARWALHRSLIKGDE